VTPSVFIKQETDKYFVSKNAFDCLLLSDKMSTFLPHKPSMKRIALIVTSIFIVTALIAFVDVSAVDAAPLSSRSRAEERVAKRRATKRVSTPMSSASSSQRSVIAPQSKISASRCTSAAWACATELTCRNGMHEVNCVLLDRICLKPETVKPATQIACASASSSSKSVGPTLLEKIDRAKALHKELIEQARDLAKQKNGSHCVRELDVLSGELVERINAYVKIYNGESISSPELIRQIDDGMRRFEEKFRAAPIVCY